MPVIGLTGGIATGKSTVARMLAGRGGRLFSADQVAHEITRPGSPALLDIAREFGSEYILPDGALDRARLAALVFGDPDAKRQLEAITHPRILAELRHQIQAAQAEDPSCLIVVEVPLLFEAGLEDWFDAVVTVVASPEIQRRRLMERSGLSLTEAEARISSQMPLAQKAARSRYVITNDGSEGELERDVDALAVRLRAVDGGSATGPQDAVSTSPGRSDSP